MDMTPATLARYSERSRSTGVQARAGRAFKLMSVCNALILKAHDERQLLTRACRDIVKFGGYGFAVAAQCGKDMNVRAVASSAAETGTAASADGLPAGADIACDPVATAIKTGHVAVSRELMTDPSLARARKWAIANNYRSCAVLPLSSEGKVFGVLAIYGHRSDAFDPGEIELLTEIAAMIGFAVGAHRARQAREELARMLDASHDAIFSRDAKGLITSWNPGAERLFGYSAADVLGRTTRMMVPEDGLSDFEDLSRRIEAGEPIQNYEIVRLAKDGSRIAVSATVSPIFDSEGRLVGSLTTGRDITERKSAEQALRESHAMLTRTEHLASIGGWDYDPANNVLRWSEGLYLIFGRDPKSFTPTLAGFLDSIHPDDRDRMLAYVEGCLQRSECPPVEFRIVRPDGTERILDTRVEIARDHDRGVHIVGISHDVTDHQKTQRELAFNTAVLTTEHELSPDGILVVDRRGRVVSINRRMIDMWKIPEDLVLAREDRPMLEYVTAQMKDPEGFLARVRYLYSHPEEKGFEQLALKDGRTFDRYSAAMQTPDGDEIGRVWYFRDITDKLQSRRMLERINRTLKMVSDGNEALVRTDNEPELLQKMCRVAVETGGYRSAWIGFDQDDDAKSVRPVGWAGDDPDYIKDATISWGEGDNGRGPTGTAIRTGEPQIAHDFELAANAEPWRAALLSHGYRSSIALPLKDRHRTFGALTIYAAESDAFRDDEVKLLIELAEDLSYGINSLRDRVARDESVKRLRQSMDATVRAIASTLELRDPYTAGHQRRVGDLAAAIGREMGIPDEEIEGIYLAGVVHDIGKINVPAEILGRPGKLSKLEYQIIQTHAQTGHDIVKGVEFPWPIAKMILQHHERLDGSGYPNGLKDKDILIGAKILAVADVVEAMTAHRPYRAALGIETALAEIENGKGRLYDPRAVDVCLKLLRSGAFRFVDQELSVAAKREQPHENSLLPLADLR